ncbi:hypothetical protein CJD36_016295 [Flavipsychrobacter stenotrophus]|uniref:Outer membrane protein beta-barrel domain-containing protein n=1 Tax=Flavipsychrobacter stenotrophus TaxID=2077091 RepID=A0A2S7SUG7_9BACT|nr:TonB-dependent receptor [Flavipsychrobacter stenotrophus]PQJ10245.1 hypothetical protein CJD36_016295 [Flavipsychrobacter stenotrophus]
MNRYLFLLLLLCSTICSLAQPRITGAVKNSANIPLPYCAVALMDSAGHTTLKGTITGEDGRFVIDIPVPGHYRVQVRLMGYTEYVSGVVNIDSLAVDQGAIVLRYATHGLAEAAVKAQRPLVEFKNGTIVLNVENDLLATGNTALELLKRLPGVMVDAQNNVTVDGRGGIGFMMDGRLQQIPAGQMINILSSMTSESIASIQLIKNPSAKYDAAGTSGLINIISKKVRLRGVSGNLFESASYGKRGGSVSAFSLNYKTNKFTLLTNTSYNNKVILLENTMNRTLNTAGGDMVIRAKGRSESLSSVLNFKGGVEYAPTDRTTMGINITTAPNTVNEFADLNTTIDGANTLAYSLLSSKAYNPEHYNNPSVSTYAVHTFDSSGTQLKFSADYTRFLDEYSGLNRNSFFNNQIEVMPMQAYNNHIDLVFKVFTQKLDFTKMLTKTITLEAGEKTSFVENNNSSSVDMNVPGTETYYADTLYNNRYVYNEQILAGYVNVTKALTKGALQLGLRGEQTNIDGINHANGYSFTQHYFNLFPNLSFDYALSQKNSLQFSYSYRIDRPAYNQLNPIRIFSDALNYGTGNPQLQPQYSHKINAEVAHGRVFHFSLAYTHTDNSIYSYSFTRPGMQSNVDTTFNFAFSDQVVLGTFAQFQSKWYNLQTMAEFMYGNRRGMIDGSNTLNETFAMQGSMNNTFLLPKEWRLQLNGRYNTGFYDGIQHYNQRGQVDIAVQKKLLKGKLNTTLGIYDIFYTDYGRYTSTLPGQQYYYKQRPDSRRLRLTLNYRFGNMRIDRKVSDGEDNSRLKKGS